MQSLELICRPPYFPLIFAIIHIYRRGFIEIWYEIPRRFVDSLRVDYLCCKENVTGKDLVTLRRFLGGSFVGCPKCLMLELEVVVVSCGHPLFINSV